MAAAALAACVALTSPARATEPASTYNPIMGDHSECIALVNLPAVAWEFDGTDTGYRFDNIVWTGGVCPAGQVRVQQYPLLTISGKRMYFQRGGDGTEGTGGTADTAIRQAHIWISNLDHHPQQVSLPAGAGAACKALTGTVYYNDPQGTLGTLPTTMYYKTTGGGSRWSNYGDPPVVEGSYHPANTHYNYMLWSWQWATGTGGGQVEATINKNQIIDRCDVDSITSNSYDVNGVRNGDVRGVYGKVTNADGTVVYGWFVHSWRTTDANGNPTSNWSFLVSSTPVP
jgi:hypothetical protein